VVGGFMDPEFLRFSMFFYENLKKHRKIKKKNIEKLKKHRKIEKTSKIEKSKKNIEN
jgi:hypothetical protein